MALLPLIFLPASYPTESIFAPLFLHSLRFGYRKDYENLTRSHIGFIILAMIRLMLRRIVRLATSR
jgi:hypothetical protein